MKLKIVFLMCLSALLLASCKDDGQVGSLIQPEEDLLHVYSNMVNVSSSSVLVDSTLSKSSYFFLGEYTDPVFGSTKMEFISQIDSRVDGLKLPTTTIVGSSSLYTGISETLLQDLDSKFGKITAIESPTDMKVDSAFFHMQYADDFFGDSTTLQAVKVYALNKTLDDSKKYYTTAKVSDFCNKDTLLGSLSYQIQKSRTLDIPVSLSYINRLVNIYKSGSKIQTQAQFNDVFKGVYVSHSFNGGGVVKVNVAGFSIFYTFEAKLRTTYNGKDTLVNTADIKNKNGEHFRVLASHVFLSANKSVKRIDLVSHVGLTPYHSSIDDSEDTYTYTYTPAGVYTEVEIPFKVMVDSVKHYAAETNKVMFNSARLKVWTQNLGWKTDMDKKPNSEMLLINKDSIISFFDQNKTPDGITSFFALYDSTTASYSFDMTKAVQMRLSGLSSISDKMVIVPVSREVTESDYSYNVYSYNQELWITATQLYGSNSSVVLKRPRIDMVYTRRE
ncbi:MAG TPA: DUF4270 family protein [Paludibacteraceae bacterium]|nr:DUF4270 family protein [Paludibacteraceae bacterium]HOU69186.1 DUF4270 family protein [Paludibacteraceae bacterium]HQF50965.1 DUF4270 family protein [Paludibacteraceae bacterium]